jgi:hypothetical protein
MDNRAGNRADQSGAGSPVWGTHQIEEGADLRLEIGPLALKLRRMSGELWVSGAPAGDAAEGAWTRWAAPPEFEVAVLPTLPDRPAVVAPEVPFHLPPGARARIYVRIPLWARIAFADRPEVTLTEMPSIAMSDTWWGDLVEGELAFWLPTRARRSVESDLPTTHLVRCPLELQNDSEDVLAVEKLAVRVMHMTIYRSSSGLWANETRARYEREGEGSRIDMGDGPPPEAGDSSPIMLPREKPERGLRALTFGRLKQAAGL